MAIAKNIGFSFDDFEGTSFSLNIFEESIWIYTSDEVSQVDGKYPKGWLGNFVDGGGNPVTQSNLSALAESFEEFLQLMKTVTGISRQPIDGITGFGIAPNFITLLRWEFHLPNVILFCNNLSNADNWFPITQFPGGFSMAICEDIETLFNRLDDVVMI